MFATLTGERTHRREVGYCTTPGKIAPEIAVGDGALGFWKVLDEVFPSPRCGRSRR